MKANTYVVKPFGISEVKVIALKGDPGTPTQEQINIAVDEYMTEHPEAQIPDGSITEQKLSSDVAATLNEVDNKADKVGSYPDLIAGTADNLLSSSYQTDRTSYLLRRTPYGARERGSIVGGSIVWNQWMQEINESSQATNWGASNGTISYSGGRIVFTAGANNNNKNFGQKTSVSETSVTGHKYFYSAIINRSKGGANFVVAPRTGQTFTLTEVPDGVDTLVRGVFEASGVSALRFFFYPWGVSAYLTDGTETAIVAHPQIIDLTLMFGPTIADYIYTQEQASAGAGVALAKALAGITADYYPYDAGSIKSVEGLTAHKTTGFNQWDEEWEVGLINKETGQNQGSALNIRSKNYIPVVPSTNYFYYFEGGATSVAIAIYYDENKNYIGFPGGTGYCGNVILKTPDNCHYVRFYCGQSYGTTYNNDICINISDPAKNGTYEPYTAHTYPLDSSLTLRGLLKLDGDSIYYDGDIYKADGTVERRYGVRAYQSGDESDANVLTDGTNTVYKLTTPTTEQAEPYTELQICDPSGTEEWVGASMPVGHDTKYYADLKGKIEDIPDAPSASGTYVLKATVSSSGVTYSWVEG